DPRSPRAKTPSYRATAARSKKVQSNRRRPPPIRARRHPINRTARAPFLLTPDPFTPDHWRWTVMAGKSKWLKGAEPNDRLEDVARQAIASRLDLVWDYLQLAADEWHESSENVHQLRVWSRRGLTAIAAFEDLLPARRAGWMRKQLKRARRAAGAARDLDVLAARLGARAEKPGGTPFAKLKTAAESERNDAQQPIVEMH